MGQTTCHFASVVQEVHVWLSIKVQFRDFEGYCINTSSCALNLIPTLLSPVQRNVNIVVKYRENFVLKHS